MSAMSTHSFTFAPATLPWHIYSIAAKSSYFIGVVVFFFSSPLPLLGVFLSNPHSLHQPLPEHNKPLATCQTPVCALCARTQKGKKKPFALEKRKCVLTNMSLVIKLEFI